MKYKTDLKKYLTLAALLAAGTTFALADDETTDDTTTSSVTITDETNGGSSVVTQERIEASNTSLSNYANYYLDATVVETTGTVSNFYISSDFTSTGDAYNVDNSNNDNSYSTLLFKGTGTVCIAGINIDTGTLTKDSTYNTYSTYQALIVADNATVVIDGVTGDDDSVIELALNISVGTYPSGSEDSDNFVSNVATLTISGGSKIETSAYYNAIGSNGQTGILNVTGEGTELYMQQTTLGAGTSGLASASTTASRGYYYPKYLHSEAAYEATFDNLGAGDSEINVLDGAKLYIGCGNSSSHSRNKLSIRDGYLTVDGDGSELILGNNSALVMGSSFLMQEGYDATFDGGIIVSNGGSVSVETVDGEEGSLYAIEIGGYSAGDSNYSIEVTGEGSSLNLSATSYIKLGTSYSDYGDYANTFDLTVSDGATASLSAARFYIGGYSDSEGSSVETTISVEGEDSSLTLSGSSYIVVNYNNTEANSTTISVSDGATLTTEGGMYLYENTTVTVGNADDSDAADSTWSADAVYVYYGASVTVEDGGTLEATEIVEDTNGESSVVVKSGGTLALSESAYVVVGDAATFIIEEDATVMITISAETLEAVTDGFIQIVSDSTSETEGTHSISDINLVIVLDGVTLDDLTNLVILETSVVDTFTDSDVTELFASITVDGESLDVASVLSNSSGTISITSIPEPGAFGVLAGAIALAFAASRRRRSRRA